MNTQPSPQYSSDPLVLIDRHYGERNFRDPAWLGFPGINMEAVVDLGKIQDVESVTGHFMEDQGSWILFPAGFEVRVSADGNTYTTAGNIDYQHVPGKTGSNMRSFTVPVNSQVRFIQVTAKNIGKLPEWHPATGGNAYLFVDEIEIN